MKRCENFSFFKLSPCFTDLLDLRACHEDEKMPGCIYLTRSMLIPYVFYLGFFCVIMEIMNRSSFCAMDHSDEVADGAL
jgi:hypothetical protein